MTGRKRIVLNILATYGRSLYGIVLGLFSTRWALQALGTQDFGIYGVIGGLVAMVGFFNQLLATTVGRFYAFAVGKARKAQNVEDGIQECRAWFSVAVFLHTLVPILLIIIGYPMGVWAIRNYLNIPLERAEDAIWVWRFTCVSCFVSMVNVPYQAMYTAKQYIAELTLYSFATATLNFIFLYYIVTHEGVWLKTYAFWMSLMVLLPQMIICIRARIIFPECRLIYHAMCDKNRLFDIFRFAGSKLLCASAQMLANQGVTIVVNKFLGPSKNAVMSIAHGVNGHASSLSAALSGAFMPAITNMAGEGNLDKMRQYAMRTCLYGTLCVLIFALPLMLEIDEIMLIWLGTPPKSAGELCLFFIVMTLIERMTEGHWVAVFSVGRIAKFQATESLAFLLGLLLSIIFVRMGNGILSIGVALLIARSVSACIKIYFGARVAGLSVVVWVRDVFIRVLLLAMWTLLFGVIPRLVLTPSFSRIVITTAVCLLVFIPLTWFKILYRQDRGVIINKIRHKLHISRDGHE